MWSKPPSSQSNATQYTLVYPSGTYLSNIDYLHKRENKPKRGEKGYRCILALKLHYVSYFVFIKQHFGLGKIIRSHGKILEEANAWESQL